MKKGIAQGIVAAASWIVLLGISTGPLQSAESTAPTSPPAAEPELKPGIPGLKMADVRDHNHLWRELQELQEWEVDNRLSIADFRTKSIEKTAQFLGFEGAEAERFSSVSMETLTSLRAASRASKDAKLSMVESEEIYKAGLDSAVVRMQGLLQDKPRHQVFEPKLKLWLLKLALGPSDAEEQREAKAAQEGGRSTSATPPARPRT